MDAATIKAIADLAETKVLDFDGEPFFSKPVFNPPLPVEPRCTALELDTLSGFCDYVTGALQREGLGGSELIIHIESATCVRLYSTIKGATRTRDCYIVAEVPGDGFQFGVYHPHANFMIALQSQFEDYGDRAKIMKIIGTIKAEASKTSKDDGIGQIVVAASGVILNQEVQLPNPVMLRPRRTFIEVEQPPSQFVLRVQDKPGQLPQLALFEADGGAWAIEAMKNIKEFIVGKVGQSGVVVLA